MDDDRPLIFIGDIHLGRVLGAFPDTVLADLGLDLRQLSPEEAWFRSINHAIRVRARAVVLAGDVVDDERDCFEALRALQAGAEQLRNAGIGLLAVAGNHDQAILPRLVQALPEVQLIGAGGQWECVMLREARPAVALIGWSFPSERVYTDPLASLPDFSTQIDVGSLQIGVLHGDLDNPASKYAPISRAKLEASAQDAWFLGHIHKPDPLSTQQRPVGYLGSLCGLDSAERGVHGPWEVWLGGGQVRARQVPLAPVHWAGVQVDVTAARNDVEVLGVISAAIAQHAERNALPEACVVAVCVELVGFAERAYLQPVLDAEYRERSLVCGTTRAWVERVIDHTQLPIDLTTLATQPHPAGWLAAQILQMQAGHRPAIESDFADDPRWAVFKRKIDPYAESPTQADWLQAAWRALEALLASGPGASHEG